MLLSQAYITQTDNDDIIIFGRSSPLLDLCGMATCVGCIQVSAAPLSPLVAQTHCTLLLYDVLVYQTHCLCCARCTAWNSRGLYSILIEGGG